MANKLIKINSLLLPAFLLFYCVGKDEEVQYENFPENYIPLFISNLDHELNESSGLVFFNNQLWTINDSNNENINYEIMPSTGKGGRKVTIRNATNLGKVWLRATLIFL